jgi:uroporphyrinogen-III synthase
MENKNISILSTRPVGQELIDYAAGNGVKIEQLSFIRTEPVESVEVQQEIESAALLTTTIVFTSMNAVDAVAEQLNDMQPDWSIFCIGHATQEKVSQHFGKHMIAGTADNASELAELIIEEMDIDEVFFFCGDQRREELPTTLRDTGIEVNEIVVYQTIATPQKVKEAYQAFIFFSPSAVESIFSINKPNASALFFAIGETTAQAIQKYHKGQIIISPEPSKQSMIETAIDFFS